MRQYTPFGQGKQHSIQTAPRASLHTPSGPSSPCFFAGRRLLTLRDTALPPPLLRSLQTPLLLPLGEGSAGTSISTAGLGVSGGGGGGAMTGRSDGL